MLCTLLTFSRSLSVLVLFAASASLASDVISVLDAGVTAGAEQDTDADLTPEAVDALERRFGCQEKRQADVEACRALTLFRTGEPLSDTFGREGWVGVGFRHRPDRPVERELVVLEYQKEHGFHASVWGRNRLGIIFVRPFNEKERRSLKEAIAQLLAGKVPHDNAAFRWARRHKFESGDFVRLRRMDRSSLGGRYWFARQTEKGVVVVAYQWAAVSEQVSIMYFQRAHARRA